MTGEIAEEPFARAVLRHLATTRGENDPGGSFARTVINGAADFSWHNRALAAGALDAQREQQSMMPEQRAEVDREADRLRKTSTADEEQR